MKEKKQRVEYMTLDLSPARSWDTRKNWMRLSQH